LVFSQQDQFLGVSLAFVVIRDDIGGRARWFFWSGDVGLEVMDMSFFSDFIDGRRQILIQDSMGTSLGRHATTTCASLLGAGMFIDSQSLIGDGTILNLAMVEARRFFQCPSRRPWRWVAATGYGICRKR
jgi:hypothetical protein